MINFLDGLNNEQIQAVEHNEGTLIILAGAGCGKTKVLTSRIANLIQHGNSAYEILAVTFTNKAAKEMKERLAKWLGEECVKRMWVGTFHGIAGRILRSDIDKYISKDGKKYDKSFVIYDDSDMNAIIKNALKKLNLDEKVYPVKQIRQVISDSKNKMITSYDFETRARSYRDQQYAKIYTEYQNQLALNNAVDFDDMLLMACELLKNNPDVREKYFKRFKHILVDEFQDTNLAQYNFIKSIYTNDNPMYTPEKRSLCTVGDIDQSIYSWRGADYRILLNMQVNFPDARLIKLEQNYRSTGTILNAANAIIKNNMERTEKNLYSNLGTGEPIEVFESGDEDEEADYILRNIKSLKNNFKLSEICVLYRTNSQSRKIEDACIYHSIPYKIVGGQKFYDRKEIKDIVAYLKLVSNHSDSQSLARIINVPKRSIGETTVTKLREISAQQGISIFEILFEIDNYDDFSSGTKTKLKNFYNLILKLQEKEHTMPLPDFITYLLDETGYINGLRETEDEVTAESRIDNIQEFINVAKEFVPTEEGQDNILGEFLSQVALVSDIDTYEEEDNALTLMTLHSAKGLEFDVVFLAGLDEGIFPHSRSLNTQGFAADAEMEEERRLMYVGVTRARKKLYITHAERRKMWGNYQFYNPSRFIGEIPNNLKTGCVVEERKKSSQNSYNSRSSSFNTSTNKKNTNSFITFENGKLAPQTTFGKNFIAPQKRAFVSNKSGNSEINKQANEEKIKKILDDNPIKRRIAEARERASIQSQKNASNMVTEEFQKGDRVFHSQFGVGYIQEVKSVAGTTLYIVEFGKYGQKSFDSLLSHLKKF
ncbi:UvrD-helicase domain-containing protein [bacterium]|nr:UvrD-helicase domain-containing protein [bacterium]